MDSKTLPFLLSLLLSIHITAPVAQAESCAMPCGSPLSGSMERPMAVDALEVLRNAVGLATTCYPCECDVTGNGNGITASDALVVLKRAVGLNVAMACPACPPIVGDVAYTRGRAAMERNSLARADLEFGCSLEAGVSVGTTSAANTFAAIAAVLHYVAENPEVQILFAEAGGYGSLDFYDFTAAVSSFHVPPAAHIRAVVVDGLDDVLAEAIARLAIAKADTGFVTQVTTQMLPPGLHKTQPSYDMDATDAALFSGLFHLVRFATHFTVKMYDDSTVDEMSDDWAQLCNPDFLGSAPAFFTVVDDAARLTAKTELKAGLRDINLAFDLVDAELDPQSDDLLVRDDLPTRNTTKLFLRDEDAVATAMLSSMDAPTPLSTCEGEALSLRFGRLFDTPLDRADLPDFSLDLFGVCKVDKLSFPDLTFHQVFDRDVPVDEMERNFPPGYPMCHVQ